jgi:hypothetical protein
MANEQKYKSGSIIQTNRTLLLAEVNNERENIITLLSENFEENLSDEKIKEINTKLLVKSFAEFEEKFSPVIYEYYNFKTGTLIYKLKKELVESNTCIFMKAIYLIKDTGLMNTILNWMSLKNETDKKEYELSKIIEDAVVVNAIKKLRYILAASYFKVNSTKNYGFTKTNNINTKKDEIAKELIDLVDELLTYKNSIKELLCIAIEDIELELATLDEDSHVLVVNNNNIVIGESPDLKTIGYSDFVYDRYILNEKIAYDLRKVLLTYMNDAKIPMQIRELLIRVFAPVKFRKDTDTILKDEIKIHDNYLEWYKKIQEDFFMAALPLVENIVGVKAFFNQYRGLESEDKPSLLITNMSLEKHLEINNLTTLEKLLRSVNDKNDFKETIWLAILPKIDLTPINFSRIQRQRFKGHDFLSEEVQNNKELVSSGKNINNNTVNQGITTENIVPIISLFYKYKILTFFDFTNEIIDMKYVATNGIEKIKKECGVLARKSFSEYAVPSFPNLTIMPHERINLIVGKKINTSNYGEENIAGSDLVKILISGIYIGAAYAAAGLTAASQSVEYLKQYFKNVNANPGVHFNIEDKDNNCKVITTMPREIAGYPDEMKTKLKEDKFGYLFSSDRANNGNKRIENIIVYHARNLHVRNEHFEPIYKTLVMNYIERAIRQYSNDYKQDSLIRFFDSRSHSPKNIWQSERHYINSVLYEGDILEYEIDGDNCVITLMFEDSIRTLKMQLK